MAVVRALVESGAPAHAWAWGEYVLLPAQRRLTRGGDPVEVEDRVFDLLVLLLQHRERALDRQEVITAIWGKRPVSDATLRQLVYKTRRAVGDDGEHQSTICTVYGRSMQWVAPVEEVFEAGEAHAGTTMLPAAETPAAADMAPDAQPVPQVERRRLPDRRSTAISIPSTTVVAAPIDKASGASSGPLALAPRRARMRRAHVAWLIAALVFLACGGAVVWTLRAPRRKNMAAITPAVPSARDAADAQTATVAVLPFLDLDPNQDQRYVSYGLTEELINRLARMPRLRVTARTSSFAFRGKPLDVRDVAKRLGVAHVLEGSVQKSGDRWRVRVALVDARNGYELWADEYNAGAGDLLNMEDHISDSVVRTLSPKLGAGAQAPPRGDRHVVEPAAHDAYMVGLEYLRQRDFVDIDRAIAYFQRAIKYDPVYVDAWTGLASGYAMLRDYNPDERPDTHYAEALAAVNKALALDSQSPRAHALLAMLYMRHWQWKQADAEYRRALALDPNDATTHHWYATYFWLTGDMQSALAQMRTAYNLDPLSPIINAKLSRTLLFAGDVDGAIRQGQAAVTLAPHFELAHLFLGEAYEKKGRYLDAIRETRAGIAVITAPPESDDLASLGRMEWAAGDHADALRLRDLLEARARQHYVSGVALAYIEWAVGDKDRAFANLERAAADHDALLITVSGIRYRAWCSDPRFPKLLASMNLPLH